MVVVVEDGRAGSGGFNNVFLGVDTAENYGVSEAGFLGDVGEVSERFRIAFWKLTGADEKREGQKQREREPREFETERRMMSWTGNHELLAY